MKTLAVEIINSWGFTPYLRVSVTGLCNLGCGFCHNEGNPRVAGMLGLEDCKYLAEQAVAVGIKKGKFTGGEPTLRRDLPEIIAVFKQAGFDDLSMVSNGVNLDVALQHEVRRAGIDKVTISLPTLRPMVYAKMFNTDPRNLSLVLTNLLEMANNFRVLKINCVFVPGTNFPEDVIPLVEFSASVRATLSVLSVLESTCGTEQPLSTVFAEMIKAHFGISRIAEDQKRGVSIRLFHLPNGGIVELDDFRLKQAVAQKNSNAYCQRCPVRDHCVEGPYAFRLKVDGTFKPCLIREDNEISYKPLRLLAA